MAAPAYIPPDDYSMLIRANETLSDPTLDDAGRSSALMSLSGLYPQSVASGASGSAPADYRTLEMRPGDSTAERTAELRPGYNTMERYLGDGDPAAITNLGQANLQNMGDEHIVVPDNLGQQSADLSRQIMGNIAASAPQTNPNAPPAPGQPGTAKGVFREQAAPGGTGAAGGAAGGARVMTVGSNKYEPSVMTTQTETGGKLSAAAQEEITTADDELRGAQFDAAKAKMDADAALEAKRSELAGKLAERDKLNAERVAFRNQELARRQKRLEDVIKENELQDQIKPTPAGERWANAIAVALGTLSSAITGQPNTAWEVVRKKMDDELAQQKEASRLRDKNLANQNDLYNIALQHADSEHEADLLARAAMQQQAAATLDKFAAAALPPQQKQQLEVMRAQNQSDSVRTMNQLAAENEAKTIISETKKFVPKQQIVVGGTKAAKAQNEADEAANELNVGGFRAKGKDQAKAARELFVSVRTLDESLARMDELLKRGTASDFGSSADRAEYDALAQATGGAVATINSGGLNATPEAEERAFASIPKSGAFTLDALKDRSAQLHGLARAARRRASAGLKEYLQDFEGF